MTAIATTFFQTNFFPLCVHLYLMEVEVAVFPTLLQAEFCLTCGAAKLVAELDKSIRTIEIPISLFRIIATPRCFQVKS
jgi:hypothetical protein